MTEATEVSPYWNIEAITSQLSKDNAVFANLKTCLNETRAFCEKLVKTLEQIIVGLVQDNPLIIDYNKEVRKDLSLFSESVKDLIKFLNEELIKSMEGFFTYYQPNYTSLIQKSQKLLEVLKEDKQKTEKMKEKYFNKAEEFNKLQASLISNNADETLIGILLLTSLGKSREARRETYESFQSYCQSVKEGNALIKKHETNFFSIVNSIEDIEESKNEFYRQSLLKYTKFIDQVIAIYTQRSKEIKGFLSKTAYRPDIKSYLRNFSSTTKDPFLSLYRVKFNFTSPSYEMTKLKIPLPEKHSLTDDLYYKTEYDCILTKAFNNLKAGNPFTSEEKADITERLKSSKDRLQFATFLQHFTANQMNISEAEAKSLLELCNHLMDQSLEKKEISPYVLNELLNASRKIIVKLEDCKKPLYSYLIQHDIWKEIDIWKLLIDDSIKTKIEYIKERKAEKMKNEESEGGIIGIFSKVKNTVSVGVSKILPEGIIGGGSIQWESVLEILSQFCFYLSTPRLGFNNILNMYIGYVKEYNIPKIVLRDLVLKLMKCQKEPNCSTTKDVYINNYTVKGQIYQKKKAFALSLVIKYIDDKITLRNVLLLNKFLNAKLKVKVFRHLLVRLRIKVNVQQRISIWTQLLNIVRFTSNRVEKSCGSL